MTALATRALGRRTAFVFIVGVIGASMFLGDSVITPAISVLSAVEGLKLASPAFGDFVVPLTVIILIALFAAQSRGTARVAAMFGPIMVVWFVSIAIAGGLHIRDDPTVLFAINPYYGVNFLIHHGTIGLVTLGAVFLVVTGGEALYADLGHFGRKPIQMAWLSLVFPALLINYFGQGAKVLADPAAIENPFYRLVPGSVSVADDRSGNGSHRHRKSGRHHRRLFTGASGDPARHAAASCDPAHFGLACRPNLYSACNRLADGWCAAAGRALPHVERACVRLRYCRRNDHGGRRAACVRRDLEADGSGRFGRPCC